MRVIGVFALIAGMASASHAQDFVPAVPLPITEGVAPLLDLAIPPRSTAPELASAAARPFGMPELDAGWLAAGGGWRSLRGAIGVAREGDRSLGWQALGAGIGWAGPEAGVAVRAAVRRDRSSGAEDAESLAVIPGAASGAEIGAEIGAGGWLQLGAGARVWVAHPQIATRGSAPPLRRALEAGIRWQSESLCMWFVREASPATRTADSHRAGLARVAPRTRVWSEIRDAPLRAAVGVAARAGPFAVAAVADVHPVLPMTARVSIGVGGERW